MPRNMDFEKTEFCWGEFAESEESNELTLDTCLNGSSQNFGPTRHTGSTLTLIDWDNDNDQDLVLGDVDYPDLILLINGGDANHAKMISQTNLFPSEIDPVKIFSMPVASFIDVNFDGHNDLIFSSFDP